MLCIDPFLLPTHCKTRLRALRDRDSNKYIVVDAEVVDTSGDS